MKKRCLSLVGALFVLSATRVVEAETPPEPDSYLSCHLSTFTACIGGRVMKQGAVSGLQPGANFSVRLCRTSPFWFCETGYADSGGYFLFSNGIQAGQYYVFAWRDDIHWGSYGDNGKVYNMPANCGGAFNPCKLDAQPNPIISYPRPLPPVPQHPVSEFVMYNCGYPSPFEWAQPQDPDRVIPGSTVRYNFWEDETPNFSMMAQSNVSATFVDHNIPPAFPWGVNRFWRVEAKISFPSGLGLADQYSSSWTANYSTGVGSCDGPGPGPVYQ
ncbi:MAG: hypothetical protein JNK60_11060 [Acidobacteria bacterium]|nr:hypothetical protein [Acidobacteriota bacterium]